MCVFLVAVAAFVGWLFGWDSDVWGNAILFLAMVVAIVSLGAVRRTERQKATLDFLRAYNDSVIVNDGAKILNNPDADLSSLNEDDKMTVREFFNLFEVLAVGLKNGIYDEQMVRDALETAIIRYHKRGQSFIEESRRRDGDVREVAFEHFVNLAERLQRRVKSR